MGLAGALLLFGSIIVHDFFTHWWQDVTGLATKLELEGERGDDRLVPRLQH
jgi:hypothetical protein